MEDKPTLGINKDYFKQNGYGTLGVQFTFGAIERSGVFNLEWHDDSIKTMRGERATILHYKGKRIYLDFWEYPTPSHTLSVLKANFDLIIKLQHSNPSAKNYIRYSTRKNLFGKITDEERIKHLNKVVPWSFFPSKMIIPLINQPIVDSEIERFGFFCGKDWKTRGPARKFLSENGVEITSSNQELRSGRPLSDEEYLHRMRSSKFGIVLQGRGSLITDVKNRREIDYMILRKPLLMSYKPFYYDPLIPGKHYIYFDQNTDLTKLENEYNVKEIESNAYEWFQNNVTDKGMATTLLKILNDKL